MTRGTRGITAAALTAGAIALASCGDSETGDAARSFSDPTRIDNRYLPLTKFRRCVLGGDNDEGRSERTVRTLLPQRRTFTIDGARVPAVTMRDDSYEDGRLVETTLDYFAQADDGTVLYLGEHVRNVKNGRVVDTKGTWLLGEDTDVPGVAMPAEPALGDQWRFEDVPGVTTESDRVEETGMRARVGGRIVTGVIRVQEFIQPEGAVEHKLYAPGTGVIAEYPPGGRVTYAGCR